MVPKEIYRDYGAYAHLQDVSTEALILFLIVNAKAEKRGMRSFSKRLIECIGADFGEKSDLIHVVGDNHHNSIHA